MRKNTEMLKQRFLSWNPVLNVADRLFRLSMGVLLTATSVLFIWRAGSTSLAKGVWHIPAVPEAGVVVTGAFLLPTALLITAKSVLPQRVNLFGGR
jgi:hypothetical protein